MTIKPLVLLSLLPWAWASAHAVTDPWLPADAQVVQAIASSPGWQAQTQQTLAAAARADQLAHIEQPWTTLASYGQRHNRAPAIAPQEARTREWSVGIERQTRWPGQAQAAHERAQEAQALKDSQAQQAWLQHLREALELHQAWLTAAMTEQHWLHQRDLAQQQAEAIRKRQKMGDATRIDLLQVEATLAQAQSRQLESTELTRQAASKLQSKYPAWPLALPADISLRPPTDVAQPPKEPTDRLAQISLSHPDVKVAQARVRLSQAQLNEARSRTQPAPTLGLNWAHDNSGRERTWTVTLSMPLGSTYQQLDQQALAYDSQAATAAYQQALQETQHSLQSQQSALQVGMQQWSLENQANAQLQGVAQSLSKGMVLGETPLAEVLNTQRLATQQNIELIQRYFQLKAMQWHWQASTQQAWIQP